MKFSEAMVLGDSLRARDRITFLFENEGGFCGCAIGGAYLAVGIRSGVVAALEEGRIWPWLNNKAHNIPVMFGIRWKAVIGCGISPDYPSFDRVMDGKCTFEELADFVRSIEPDCGDCNQFTCTCAKE